MVIGGEEKNHTKRLVNPSPSRSQERKYVSGRPSALSCALDLPSIISLELERATQVHLVTMSQVPSTSTSSTIFETIFSAALKAYKNQTKKDIASHPLSAQLQSCDTPSSILAVLRTQVQTFEQSQGSDDKWTKWLDPTVNVLFAFSASLGNGVGVVNSETLSFSRSL